MNGYLIVIKGTEKLGDDSVVLGILESWVNHPIPSLRPNRYGFGEPLKKVLDAGSCRELAEEWKAAGRAGMLQRNTKPRFLVDFDWRKEIGRDTRLFPWGCVVWLDRSAGDANAIALLGFLIKRLDPVFAYATTDSDEKAKHFVQYKDRVGVIQKYVGLEVENQLPGIYWRTYFGRHLKDRFGSVLGSPKLKLNLVIEANGFTISPFDTSDLAGSDSAREKERSITEVLGVDAFFDLIKFDPTSIKLSTRDTKVIEAAVAEKTTNGPTTVSG